MQLRHFDRLHFRISLVHYRLVGRRFVLRHGCSADVAELSPCVKCVSAH